MTYAGGFALPILFPLTVLNTFQASTIAPGSWVLVNSNVPAGFTTNRFMRQIEDVTNAAGGPLAVSGQYKPTTLNGVVQDQATNLSAVASTPIAGAQVTTGVSKVGIADPAQQIRDFRITNAAASISTAGLNGCPAGTASTATSRTINADVSGPTATFAPPFVRVDFYVVANGYIRLIGSATTPTTTDNGAAFGRVHRYAFTWTPGGNLGGVLGKILTPPGADPATVCAGAQTVYAVGVDASGDALVTPAFGPGAPAFTLVNP
jgi:hypothetical protein